MRTISSLALLAAAVPLAAQTPFEGVLTVQMREGQQQEVQYYARPGAARMEMRGPRGAMAMVMDQQKQTMLMLIPERQMYVERPLTPPRPSVDRDAPTRREPEITRTGRMETVAGVQCEHVTVRGESGELDACLAQGMGTFLGGGGGGMGPGMGRRAAGASWRTALDGRNMGFPLKVSQGGTVMWEVTRIERRPLDASLFAAPAGWTKMDMPMGMPGMPPGGPPGARPPTTR